MAGPVALFEDRQRLAVGALRVGGTSGEMVKGAEGVQVACDIRMARAKRLGPQREASLSEWDPGGGVASRMSQATQVVQ